MAAAKGESENGGSSWLKEGGEDNLAVAAICSGGISESAISSAAS
jgi:hypothetical protein